MEDFYQILGLNPSAGSEEIKRAYRILARRYHPDVNPGSVSDRFRLISEAYQTLIDAQKRAKYDADYDVLKRMGQKTAHQTYREQARDAFHARSKHFQSQNQRTQDPFENKKPEKAPQAVPEALGQNLKHFAKKFTDFLHTAASQGQQKDAQTSKARSPSKAREQRVTQISIIEVSITIWDAIQGLRKSIEMSENESRKKISVHIPPGVRHGDIVRLRNKAAAHEEIVLLIRIAQHPYLTLKSKGLVIEVPVTIEEALLGASIQVPSLEDPLLLKIPAGSQSGTELRVRDKGAPNRDGSRGDLFFRLLVQIPTQPQATGLAETARKMSDYYEGKNLRGAWPMTIEELAKR